jgi:hypothetical protein
VFRNLTARATKNAPRRPKYTSIGEEDEAPLGRTRVRNERPMHTFLFRSYQLIVESDEADLVRDVRFDPDKAQTKLRLIKQRLKGVQEQAAAQVQLLTAAETKLSAAIVAALLSGQR